MTKFKNIAAAFALIIILFAGCKNPADDVQIVVNTDIFKSPTLIQFVNAKKGVNGPQDFTVTLIGPNADLVRTTTGGKTFKATSGLLNLVLDRNANPSVTNPVKFTVIVNNVAGFAPTFQDVIITSPTDPTLVKVAVAEYANPAAGTGAIVDTKTLNNGTTSTDVTITTATNAGIAQQATITVPTGTTFLDATGATITGSQLESRVVFNGTATNGSTPVVPGGNFGSNVIDANKQPVANGLYFSSAGSVSIDMFVGGKEVKKFTKPVNVDLEVNPTMINPNTNQPIKAGESIPMWSSSDETGQWEAEGNATFVTNSNGKLVARMPISHLSKTMVGFTFIPSSSSFASQFCYTKVVINRPASNLSGAFMISGQFYIRDNFLVQFAPGETTKSIDIEVYKSMSSTISAAVFYNHSLSTSVNRLPAPAPTYVNNNLTSEVVTNPCNQTTTFTFVAPPANKVIDVDVYVRVKCSGKDIVTGVNAMITITPAGGTSDEASVYNLTQGRLSGQIIEGTTYKIVASIDGKSYTSQFTATKDNFKLPFGSDLDGTAVYNSATNKLSIEALVTKTDCN